MTDVAADHCPPRPPSLGPPAVSPCRSTAGSPTATRRWASAERRTWSASPGRTPTCWASTAMRNAPRRARARAGVGPRRCARCSTTRRSSSPASSRGRRCPRRSCASPSPPVDVAGALRRIHDSGRGAAVRLRRVPDRGGLRGDSARARRAAVPDGYEAARKRAKAIEKALRGPEHDPVPCHNDLLAGNLLLDGVQHADPGLGVRGHGRPLLRPGQLVREQRPRRRGRGHPARGVLRRAGRRPAAWPPCT